MIGQAEKRAKPTSDFHHLPFTRSFLEACTDLKLIELRDSLLRERPEDRRDDLDAVSEELEKRQEKVPEDLMSGVRAVTIPASQR
jgi:hypothetical protein